MGSSGFSLIFSQVPTPSDFIPAGDWRGPKILSPPHQKFREKTLQLNISQGFVHLSIRHISQASDSVWDQTLKHARDNASMGIPKILQASLWGLSHAYCVQCRNRDTTFEPLAMCVSWMIKGPGPGSGHSLHVRTLQISSFSHCAVTGQWRWGEWPFFHLLVVLVEGYKSVYLCHLDSYTMTMCYWVPSCCPCSNRVVP